MSMNEVVIEFYSEEIPARVQRSARTHLYNMSMEYLSQIGIHDVESVETFATARRLGISMAGLPDALPTVTLERRGPRLGAPDKAIDGFTTSLGISRDLLRVAADQRTNVQYYYADIVSEGRGLDDVVRELVLHVIDRFPWEHSMRWGDSRIRWIRPLRSILCIIVTESKECRSVCVNCDNLFSSGGWTVGHPVLHNDKLYVSSFQDYVIRLRDAKVIVLPAERRQMIEDDIRKAISLLDGKWDMVDDHQLLDELTGIVEWPVPIVGKISEHFYDLPDEVLQVSMRTHQKFLSLRNMDTGRVERFIAILDMVPDDGDTTILDGYERVLRARLSDARFFWEQDLGVSMLDRIPELGRVIFYRGLGSQADKVARITQLIEHVAKAIEADSDICKRAAILCKADLLSCMVHEFPELQGVIGSYYAEAEGEPQGVVDAIRTHYSPIGISDTVPYSRAGDALAIADKLDTLVNFWSIGKIPTGSGDPFALRRAALGILRIVLEKGLTFDIRKMIYVAPLYSDTTPVAGYKDSLEKFFVDRFSVYCKNKGFALDVIEAVITGNNHDSLDFYCLLRKIQALYAFINTDCRETIITLKRAENIIKCMSEDDAVFCIGRYADKNLINAEAETELYDSLVEVWSDYIDCRGRNDFDNIIDILCRLQPLVDRFLDSVHINVESMDVRCNRYMLIQSFLRISGVIGKFTCLKL